MTVRGIGRWTAEMFLLFELQRPDVWPVDDLGVRHGWRLIHGDAELLKPRQLEAEGDGSGRTAASSRCCAGTRSTSSAARCPPSLARRAGASRRTCSIAEGQDVA